MLISSLCFFSVCLDGNGPGGFRRKEVGFGFFFQREGKRREAPSSLGALSFDLRVGRERVRSLPFQRFFLL